MGHVKRWRRQIAPTECSPRSVGFNKLAELRAERFAGAQFAFDVGGIRFAEGVVEIGEQRLVGDRRHGAAASREFGKDVGRQSRGLDVVGEFLDRPEANVGDLLFGQAELLGDVLVRPTFDEKSSSVLTRSKSPLASQSRRRLAEAASDRVFLEGPAFVAAGDAGGRRLESGRCWSGSLPAASSVACCTGCRPSLAQVVGQLVRRDREEIRLQFAFVVVMRQAVEEADEGFLDEIVANVGLLDAAMQEARSRPS